MERERRYPKEVELLKVDSWKEGIEKARFENIEVDGNQVAWFSFHTGDPTLVIDIEELNKQGILLHLRSHDFKIFNRNGKENHKINKRLKRKEESA